MINPLPLALGLAGLLLLAALVYAEKEAPTPLQGAGQEQRREPQPARGD